VRFLAIQIAVCALMVFKVPVTACEVQSNPRANPAPQKSVSGNSPTGTVSDHATRCFFRADSNPELTLNYCTAVIRSGKLSDSNLASALNNRGKAYYSKHNYDLAIQDYSRAIQLNPDFVDALNNRGEAYRAKGDYDRALQDFDQVIRLHPKLAATSFSNRGFLYSEKGDCDKAIRDYSEAIRLRPGYAADFAGRGNAYSCKRDYDHAIEDYKQAIRLTPRDSSLHIALGKALSEKHDLSGAIAQYRLAIQLSPDKAAGYSALGDSLDLQGNSNGAMVEYSQAAKLDDTNPSYHFSLGDELFKKKDFNGTLAEWQRAIQLVGGLTSSQHRAIGQILLQRGDLDGSIQEFRRAVQLAPDDVQNHESLAAAFARKGDANAEIDQYHQIAREKPNDLGNHKRLAVALMKQKKFADAKVEFQAVLRLAPNNAGAYAGLGAAEADLGDSGQAATDLQKALQIDPQNAFAQKNLNALSQTQPETQQQSQAAPPASAPSNCNNWPPEFGEIRDPEKQDALRVDWNQKVQQSGQTIQQLLSSLDQTRNVLQAHLEDVKQSILGTADEPITSFNFDFDYVDTCKNNQNIGANLAAECEYVNTQDAIHGVNGTIQILDCMGGLSSTQADNSASPAAPIATYTPGGNDASTPTGKRVYTPGSSSGDDGDSRGVYTPGSPDNSQANDTSMGMLDTGGNLKQPYVGMTSDYSAVVDQNQSSCNATAHVTLLSSQPGGEGATLQLQASPQPNPSFPSLPSGCFELEFTIEASQRKANGDAGPAGGRTYHNQFADASDTANIELPVASSGSNDIDLIGWHVSGALCHPGGNCVKQASPEECAQLEDYKTNELPNQMMNLIKSYGIISFQADAAANLQSDLNQDVSDISQTLFLDHMKIIVDEVQDLAPIFAPEGKLANLAVELGPKPSLLARDVWKYIVEPQQQLQGAKDAIEQALNDDYSGLLASIIARYSPVAALEKDIIQDAQQIHALRALSAQDGDKISSLQSAIDDYNNSLQSITNQMREIQQVSQGIDMACGGAASSANP
jgi:tetratricopeptide (TPR) repeat protein